MKTKLLTTLVACALLISLMGCAADKTAQMLQDTADVTVNTEALTQHSADTQAVTPTAETAEKEIPAQPASTEAPLTSEMPEIYSPGESEPPKQTEPSKQTESEETPMPNDQSQSKESGKPVETQPEPAKPTEPPKETEQPKPTEPPAPPAPTEPAPTETPAPTEPPSPTEPPHSGRHRASGGNEAKNRIRLRIRHQCDPSQLHRYRSRHGLYAEHLADTAERHMVESGDGIGIQPGQLTKVCTGTVYPIPHGRQSQRLRYRRDHRVQHLLRITRRWIIRHLLRIRITTTKYGSKSSAEKRRAFSLSK